jgi:hypothetical protein
MPSQNVFTAVVETAEKVFIKSFPTKEEADAWRHEKAGDCDGATVTTVILRTLED